jgi:hypothetical protein
MAGSQGFLGSGARQAVGAAMPISKAMIIGAMLKDAGNGLRGVPSDSLGQLRALAFEQQMMGDFLGDPQSGDAGPQPPAAAPGPAIPQATAPPPYQSNVGQLSAPQVGINPTSPMPPSPLPPQATPRPVLDPSDPRFARRMMALSFINPQAAQALARVAQATRPEVAIGPDGRTYNKYDPRTAPPRFASPSAVNNTIVDLNDPNNINRMVPSAPVPGAVPVYDNLGRVTDWTLPAGARQAILDSKAEDIRHNKTIEGIEGANAVTGRMNAGTSAGGLANTQTQNSFVPPPGFVIRQRGNR